MKGIIVLFALVSTLTLSVFADVAVILIPGSDDVAAAEQQKSRAQAELFRKWLDKQNLKAAILTSSEFTDSASETSKLVFVCSIWNYSTPLQQSLTSVVNKGGTIIWQGFTAGRININPGVLAFLRQAAGTDYRKYAYDPMLGQGAVDQYMFIRPETTGEAAVIWKGEIPPMLAMFAGEKFDIYAVENGFSAGEWLQRDRKTSNGTALIIKTFPSGGASIMLSLYNFNLAAEDKKDNLPSYHSAIMLEKILSWRGFTLKTEMTSASVVDASPINDRAVTLDYECPRSMWVWVTDDALDPKKGSDLIEFSRRRHIDILYLYTGSQSIFKGEERIKLRRFIAAAHAAGIKVEALDGWKEAVYPEEQGKFLKSLENVLEYNSTVEAKERFSGFQSDVEPQCLEAFHTSPDSRKKIELNYVKLHYLCRQLIDSYKFNYDFKFGMAVSEHLDAYAKKWKVNYAGRELSVLEHFLSICDYLAIMCYYDTPGMTIRRSQGQVDAAKKAGITAWVGFESLDVHSSFGGSRSITYYEEGLEQMEKNMRTVYKHYQNNEGFGGLALHYYTSLRRLPDKPRDIQFKQGPALQAPYVSQINIDGNTSDWKSTPQLKANSATHVVHGQEKWHGKNDLSMTVHTAWDEQNIYFLAEITDDIHVSGDGGEDLWKWDHLEIWLQAGKKRFQIGIAPKDFTEKSTYIHVWHPLEMSPKQRSDIAGQINCATLKTTNGYIIEGRIPVSSLGMSELKQNDSVNILFELGDADKKNEACRTMLSVAPSREREIQTTYARMKLKK
jgi:hypothetical protein